MLRQQTVLARFGEFALKAEDIDAILTEACRLVGEALGTDLAKVMEHEHGQDRMLLRAGIGWRPGVVGHVRVNLSDDAAEFLAVTTGEAVITADTGQEDRFRLPAFLVEHGVRAFANVLILGGEGRPPFGVLEVDSVTPRDFLDSDVAFLRSYANLIGGAVERLRAIAALRASNQELERRVEERTRELRRANDRLRQAARERDEVQASLREAAGMQTVVEHLPIGAALIAPSGDVIIGNPEFRRLLGRPRIPSADQGHGDAWIAFDGEGRRIKPQDFPGARALRGEVTLGVDFLHAVDDQQPRWCRISGVPVKGPDRRVIAALVVMIDVDDEHRAQERQALLTREVDHRAKNMLAVVQAALRLTRAETIDSFVHAIEGRIAALARAQTLLAADRWSGADLRSLIQGELGPFLVTAAPEAQGAAAPEAQGAAALEAQGAAAPEAQGAAAPEAQGAAALEAQGAAAPGTTQNGAAPCQAPRASLSGETVVLPAGAAQPFSMAIHELATNAIKYGALSAPDGRLAVSWTLDRAAGQWLRLRWVETGGPPPPPHRTPGFGSRVLHGTVQDQLGGRVTMAWEAPGLVCDLEIPLHRQPPG
ncbi:HWE histidine kinase domain-containing protein [Falsiroseomonas stagni]|uniref:histidine kinase n=1 Tax=Falsiroseomonas stagni DSM 19981 TaxID=1123062 RepID=A0A1I4BEQ9_9PROT|nr:HWE histidine kinase domain-containing protein [Falsiroseomonas stagni]SFK67295.1 PAS fold-containing protein [Falsiroseomonas stagni DSM 19981]